MLAECELGSHLACIMALLFRATQEQQHERDARVGFFSGCGRLRGDEPGVLVRMGTGC